ncbi:MAG: hypothetical protein V1753_01425 [Pseudomonadota bacterium]
MQPSSFLPNIPFQQLPGNKLTPGQLIARATGVENVKIDDVNFYKTESFVWHPKGLKIFNSTSQLDRLNVPTGLDALGLGFNLDVKKRAEDLPEDMRSWVIKYPDLVQNKRFGTADGIALAVEDQLEKGDWAVKPKNGSSIPRDPFPWSYSWSYSFTEDFGWIVTRGSATIAGAEWIPSGSNVHFILVRHDYCSAVLIRYYRDSEYTELIHEERSSPLVIDINRNGKIDLGGTMQFDIAPDKPGIETIAVPVNGDMFL